MWHTNPIQEVLSQLDTNPKAGLSAHEAKSRLRAAGTNTLPHKKKAGFFRRFFAQFQDFMILVLLAAAFISFGVSLLNGDADFLDPIIILLIVVLNAILGVVQESRAEKSLEALQKICAPTALVRRDGTVQQIPAADLVPGDIVILKTGDQVPADCRLLSATALQTDESALTGESMPVVKSADAVLDFHTPLAERKNMVLSSTVILGGHGEAVVTETGLHTEMGKIAGLILHSETKETPLQKKLSDIGKVLGIGALAICGVIFVIGLFQQIPPFSMFMLSVSLAVAAIPEGLPAIVTVMLAIGVSRMAQKNAIIRNIPSVETLGCASVICSDKTGTLTQNQMQVVSVAAENPKDTLLFAALCTNDLPIGQNPTERAILEAAANHGLEKAALDRKYPRTGEIPFDSKRKMMSTAHHFGGKTRIVTKGAVDILLPRCTGYIQDGAVHPMTESKKRAVLAENARLTGDALRVLAVCYKDSTDSKITENQLIFSGLLGIADPPRPEVLPAVKACRTAGIRPVMITGDHANTAVAIARQTGILQTGDRVLTGNELEKMPQKELEKCVADCSVFARVTPEHKVRIVRAWQAQGKVVAMTGDGVNDAPALQAADIGCSMGRTGTDVARSAADMILTDDNFATIVEAVRQGRGIFSNIKKAVQFLLSSNIGEMLLIFVGLLFGWREPLLPIQLLWVNLVTDSLPAVALGVDPVDRNIMQEPPRPPKKSIFADGLGVSIVLEGAMIGALALLAYSIGLNIFSSTGIARTMAFSVLSLSQLVHAFNMRSKESVFSVGIFKNHYLVLAFLAGAILQMSVVSMPFLTGIFKTTALSALQWGLVALLSCAPLIIVELQKFVAKGRKKA